MILERGPQNVSITPRDLQKISTNQLLNINVENTRIENQDNNISTQPSQMQGDTSKNLPPDEQGIRKFLFKLLNSQSIFSKSDIVDQIEAFIQIKIDRCS